MDKRGVNAANTDRGTENEQTLRPWITPTFERVRLEEALSNVPLSPKHDGGFNYS